jgi:hypothetical protein
MMTKKEYYAHIELGVEQMTNSHKETMRSLMSDDELLELDPEVVDMLIKPDKKTRERIKQDAIKCSNEYLAQEATWGIYDPDIAEELYEKICLYPEYAWVQQ